jgi:hypothetical protein
MLKFFLRVFERYHSQKSFLAVPSFFHSTKNILTISTPKTISGWKKQIKPVLFTTVALRMFCVVLFSKGDRREFIVRQILLNLINSTR